MFTIQYRTDAACINGLNCIAWLIPVGTTNIVNNPQKWKRLIRLCVYSSQEGEQWKYASIEILSSFNKFVSI